MQNQPIGILDSGVGGLSIWREIVVKLPKESIIYIADSLNCPYGSRSKGEIYQLAKRMIQFLIDQKVKLIVIACNTITVSCLELLRKDFPQVPIIGTVPVIKTAVLKSRTKKIGVLSTIVTAKSTYQKNLIKQFAGDCFVTNHGTDAFVPLIEQGRRDTLIIRIIRVALQPFIDGKIDVLVLGCSHFPFVKTEMQKILGKNVLILDSGAAIARQVGRVLTQEGITSKSSLPQHLFYTTGEASAFARVSKKLAGKAFAGKIQRVKSIRV